ncbi:cytochrome P450 [Trametes gibbosa]|nr:cytochrome P450 [Trametes gibbosa]
MPSMAVAAVLLLSISAIFVYRKTRFTLPPGPRRLPIIGNLLDMTPHEIYKKAVEWGKGCKSDIVCLNIVNTPYVFLNSAEVVNDLLHKRGAIYSDRAHMTFAEDLCGFGDFAVVTKYGDRFKLERKLMNQALGLSAVEKWQPEVDREARLLLLRLLQSPDAFVQHFRRYAGSLIFSTMYGHHVAEEDDPYIKESEEFMVVFDKALTGPWMVDFFTWLRWVPGLNFHKVAEQWRARLDVWINKPLRLFKNLPDTNSKRNSFCGHLLLDDNGKFSCDDAESEYRVKWLAASMYGAASDTTVVALSTLILILCHHPEVVQKAQQELDGVLGTDRLPSFQDRPRLPYIDCIIKEVLRWGTPAPMTPPHRLIQDDRYRGFDLPKGSFCVGNIWAIQHDDALYPDPFIFSPERFETKPDAAPAPDSYNYSFGFGRRRCPGVHFADQALWLACAALLACFDITPRPGASPPTLEFATGAFRHPEPFVCSIRPRRGAQTATLIETEARATSA